MATKRSILVVGTGTIGEPLIGLLLGIQQDLDIDGVTFHKNRPLLRDRSKVINLIRRGAGSLLMQKRSRSLKN